MAAFLSDLFVAKSNTSNFLFIKQACFVCSCPCVGLCQQCVAYWESPPLGPFFIGVLILRGKNVIYTRACTSNLETLKQRRVMKVRNIAVLFFYARKQKQTTNKLRTQSIMKDNIMGVGTITSASPWRPVGLLTCASPVFLHLLPKFLFPSAGLRTLFLHREG